MIFEKKIRTSAFLSFLTGLFVFTLMGDRVQANPLSGYTIHVTAPHVMDGEIVGPFHHFCKPINKVIIQCILFDSDEPNARMTEVEYMVSKDVVWAGIPKWSHLKNWHDHDQEIKTGRVAIVNPTDPKEQKGLAEYVAKTDGIIFHLWPKGAPFPDGTVSIAQSVGHWESLHGEASKESVEPAKASAASSSTGPIRLTREVLKKLGIVETVGVHGVE
jgi:hypothetical protein